MQETHTKYGGKVYFGQIEEKYKSNMQGLLEEQFKLVTGAILVWVVPLLVLYLSGLVVAWIIAGFRES